MPVGILAQSASSFNALGSEALARGDLKTALAEFRRAARVDPSNPEIQFNLGLALLRTGNLADAISPLKQASQAASLSLEAHFLLGATYFELKGYAHAIEELSGLEGSAHADQVLYILEESNRLSGNEAEAKAAFLDITRRFPDSAWTHLMMAPAYEDQRQPEKAIEEYQLALQKDPTAPNANFAIGYIYLQQQNTESARDWLQRETLRGCHALANYYLGEIDRAEGDWRKAETFYRSAIICDHNNGDAHLRLGIVLGDQKRFGEALAELREAVRLAPNKSSAHYHLAAIYRQLGRTSQAEDEYKKIRQIQAADDNDVDVAGARKH